MRVHDVDDVDTHIGNRIRARRLALGLTQKQLGERLGIKFQQVHKYEHAVDRTHSSRLDQIAVALDTSPAYFFPAHDGRAGRDELAALIDRPDVIEVLRALKGVVGQQRVILIAMVKAFKRGLQR